MDAKKTIMAALAGIVLPVSAAWRSELYPSDWTPPVEADFQADKLIQDFSYAGYHRGEQPVPDVQGPVFDAVAGYGADPSGAVDSTAAIQNAIDAAQAGGGGVVFLPEGTYRVGPQAGKSHALRIGASGIVLRGAGADKTRLLGTATNMRSKQIVLVSPSVTGWNMPAGGTETLLRSDLAGPVQRIPVEGTDGFSVGDRVVLRADATDDFIAEHNMADLWAGHGGTLGGVRFLRLVTAVHAGSGEVEIDVPIRYYLKTRDNARMHHAPDFLEEVGLEDFSVGNLENPVETGWLENDYTIATNGSYQVHNSYAVQFGNAWNGWIRRIKTFHPSENTTPSHIPANGILCSWTRSITVSDCEFQWPQYGGGGGNGYMYRLSNAQETLIRNSAARNMRHGFVVASMASSGNVLHACETQNTGIQGGGDGVTAGKGSDHHMHLSQSSLVDSCTADRDWFDANYRGTAGTVAHGQVSAHSVFWNTYGKAYESTVNYIVRSGQARHGYIIGTSGPAPGVGTPGIARTAPVDHSEGIGLGASLVPRSLYLDQLNRRLPPNTGPLVMIGN